MIDCICEVCSTPFRIYPADARKGGGKCCGVLCRNRRLSARNRRSLTERFWAKVRRTDGCWLWLGSMTQDGYGQMKRDGRSVRANRLSWEIHFGAVPDGLHVLHSCDNPPCVRPDHLFLGTDAANSLDRNAKGRQARGERSATARLVASAVLSIRSEYAAGGVSRQDLATKYRVGRSTIQAIVEGRSWRHLLSP